MGLMAGAGVFKTVVSLVSDGATNNISVNIIHRFTKGSGRNNSILSVGFNSMKDSRGEGVFQLTWAPWQLDDVMSRVARDQCASQILGR